MYEKYIRDGIAERGVIANAIARRELTRKDILKLNEYPEVQKAYIGQEYRDKLIKKKWILWNSDYLSEVKYDSIAKSFNLDYMLYLDEVASMVAFKKKLTLGLGLLGVIAVVLIILAIITRGGV